MIDWRGTMYGRPVEGTIESGTCQGSFEVVSIVEAMDAAGTRVSEGPFSGPADLTDPTLARATLEGVLDPGSARFEGDEPPVQELAEGADS